MQNEIYAHLHVLRMVSNAINEVTWLQNTTTNSMDCGKQRKSRKTKQKPKKNNRHILNSLILCLLNRNS